MVWNGSLAALGGRCRPPSADAPRRATELIPSNLSDAPPTFRGRGSDSDREPRRPRPRARQRQTWRICDKRRPQTSWRHTRFAQSFSI